VKTGGYQDLKEVRKVVDGGCKMEEKDRELEIDYARSVIESSIARLDKVVAGLRYTNVDRETIADYTEEIVNMLESAYNALEKIWRDGG
jgi:hypothetical protein